MTRALAILLALALLAGSAQAQPVERVRDIGPCASLPLVETTPPGLGWAWRSSTGRCLVFLAPGVAEARADGAYVWGRVWLVEVTR